MNLHDESLGDIVSDIEKDNYPLLFNIARILLLIADDIQSIRENTERER